MTSEGIPTLPGSCEVLVLGAGPAGSACAQTLAALGWDVLLVDQYDFPRDKVCGDGLIPDAHRALERLGVADEVRSRSNSAQYVRCFSPSGRHVDVAGQLSVLPRRDLDHILVRSAQRAGVRFHTPWRFESLLRAEGRVEGAYLSSRAASVLVRTRHIVLATGASSKALQQSGLCIRRSPSAMALRGYLFNPALQQVFPHLEVFWHRRLSPGYGWIFPCGEGIFNVGIGVIDSHHAKRGRMRDVNLSKMLANFLALHPSAQALVRGGEWLGAPKGAPLRNSLDGAEVSAPGVLVTGEAAGSTYAFTGEGIGKALETGILAAESLHQARTNGWDDTALGDYYRAQLSILKPKLDLYEKGNFVNHHPWLMELLIWRASRSERLQARMAAVLEERANPAQLMTLRGMYRLFAD
ncbi:MAG: NAD(P)/FAD-dependent oxidoreductase [Burkholderiaceae bacterium]